MADGAGATAALKQNVEAQLSRLLQTLQDLEDMKDDLEPEEIVEMRAETLTELEAFQRSLEDMTSGNQTLQTELGAMKLAVQEAVRQSFQTPEAIKLFASGEVPAIRRRIGQLAAGKQTETTRRQAGELALALKKLGEKLSAEEQALLEPLRHGAQYHEVSSELSGAAALGAAGVANRRASK